MNTLFVVWFKEMLDTLRDRRTLAAMIIAPVLVMPLFIILPQKLLTKQFEEQEAAVIQVAVAGSEYAPAMMDFLRASGEVEIIETGDPGELVLDKDASVGLVILPDFEAALAEEGSTQIRLLSDRSKMTSGSQVSRVELVLQSYAQAIVAERLAARGVDVDLLMPIEIRSENVATPQQMGGSFIGMMLPMLIVLWALIGGMYTAIDVTAGEKERLTLEPLLMTPVGRAQVVVGKLLAVMSTSLVALILAVSSMLIAFQVSMPAMTGEANMTFNVSLQTAALILLASLPVVLMFGSLEIAVCLLARSFKEAQNYIVPMQFVVMFPAIAVMMMPDLAPSPAAFAIPIFNTIVVLRDLLLGTWELSTFGIMLASSLVYAAVGIGVAIWQFGREKVLFRT